MKIRFFIFLIIFFHSCSNNYEISQLSPSKTLTEEKRITLSHGCNNGSIILDSLLILLSRCDSSFFYIYHKNTFELIRKFGQKGKGPFEFNSPNFYNTCTTSDLPGNFFIYDGNLAQNKIIDFFKLVSGIRDQDCIKANNLEKELITTRELNQLNNGKVAGINVGVSKGLFFIYDTLSGKKKEIPFHPKMNIPLNYLRSVYYGYLCANPSKDVIVYASRYIDQILFYNTNGKRIKEHYFSNIKQPLLSPQTSGVARESLCYFTNIYGTPERCYVLRVAHSTEDIRGENGKSIPIQLLSFDWDGNLVEIYEYKNYFHNFCIDETTKKLFYMLDNEENEYSSISSDVVQMILD